MKVVKIFKISNTNKEIEPNTIESIWPLSEKKTRSTLRTIHIGGNTDHLKSMLLSQNTYTIFLCNGVFHIYKKFPKDAQYLDYKIILCIFFFFF